MPTEEKVQQVAELEEKIKKSVIAVSAEFRGVTVAQVSDLRRKLREAKIEVLVVKNTLAGIAAEKAGKAGLREVLKGPTVIAFSYGDPVGAPKALSAYLKANQLGIKITGAITEGRVLSPAEVEELATMPSREILLGRVMGGLFSPLYGLMYALNFHIGGLTRALEGRRKQMEPAEGASGAAA